MKDILIITRKHHRVLPSWYSPDLKAKVKKKNKMHGGLNKYPASAEQRDQYSKLRKDIKLQTKREFASYQVTEANINSDPKKVWDFVNNKKSHSGIPPEMAYEGTTYCEQYDIAQAFAGYFQSVYQKSAFDDVESQEWGGFA